MTARPPATDMSTETLGGRLELSGRTAVLAAGDAIAIGVFVAAGELSHGRPILEGGGTFLQFGVGWLAAALLIGAYGRHARLNPRGAVVLAAGTWLLADLLAQVLRALVQPGFDIAPAFLAISLVIGGGLIAGWRALAAALLG